MLRFAFGTLRWPPSAVWAATPREIAAALPRPGDARMGAADLARLLDAYPDTRPSKERDPHG